MNKFLLFGVLLCHAAWLHSQSSHEAPYRVEINDKSAGYQFIDAVLGNKKVVLLGELDHGDGSSFTTKTDLIKYLHEQLGFNTLVFEASFINCNILWSSIGDSAAFKNEIKNNIYYIWSEVEETKALFDYIQEQYQKGTPLKIVGMDPQFSGAGNAKEFIALLKKTLPSNITESTQFADFVYEIEIMSAWMVFPSKSAHRLSEAAFAEYCDQLYEAIRQSKAQTINLSLWKMYLENVKKMGKIKQERNKVAFEIRDEQMFKNLDYWIKEHQNERFIVWAANAHIIRQDRLLKKKGGKFYLSGLKKLGDHLYEAYPDSIYALAITSGNGATLDFSNPTKKNIFKRPSDHSIEALMQGQKASFVDLKSFENSFGLTEYDAQLFYTNVVFSGRWSQHFDGFIYIPEMRPSTPLWKYNKTR